MRRVMICGGPGSGKSTLARQLGELTGLPVTHIDKIHWKSGWIERTSAEKKPLIAAAIAKERWIFEGGNSISYPERAARADTLIWLDLPVGLRLCRVVMRTWRGRGETRPDLPEGCPEGFYWHTLKFWKWIWDTRHIGRRKIAALIGTPDLDVYHFTHASQVAAFLRGVNPATDAEKGDET